MVAREPQRSAFRICRETLEARFEREETDPDQLDRDEIEALAQEVVDEYQRRWFAHKGTPGEWPRLTGADSMVERLTDDLHAYGRLGPYMRDPTIAELQISAPDRTLAYFQDGRIEELPLIFDDDGEVERRIRRMLRLDPRSAHHLDERHPFVDALLPGGERLHVVGPPVARHYKVNVRKPTGLENPSIEKLVETGTLGSDTISAVKAAQLVLAAYRSGLSILTVGPQGAGKTTALRALLASSVSSSTAGVDPLEAANPTGAGTYLHHVVFEEAREIDPDETLVPNIDCLSCRPSDDPKLEVTMEQLVKEGKRMLAQRIIVGEIRDSEIALHALSAAREGVPFAATLHAESATEAVDKFAYLMMLSGDIGSEVAHRGISGALDMIVVCERARVFRSDRQRWERRPRITEISILTGQVGPTHEVQLRDVFTYDRKHDSLVGVGNVAFAERQLSRFERHDVDVHALMLDPPPIDAAAGSIQVPTTAPHTAVAVGGNGAAGRSS